MDIRYKLYPYPVLSNYSDDYINSSFDSAIEVKREGYNIVISVVSEIKNSELEALIKEGKAAFVYHLECAQTGYRTVISTANTDKLLLKAQGQTLQEIGESIGVTRERVRQIIAKTVRKLNFVNGPILEKLMQGQGCFYKSDIKKLFNVPEHLDCFAYILQNSETIHYFEFADKFVDSKLIPDDWEEQLRTMMYELVGDAA